MSLPFTTLQEFREARDNHNLVLSGFNAVLDRLDLRKLNAIFTKNYFVRILSIRKWLKQVGRICGVKIKLKITSADKPYMKESGELCLSRCQAYKASYSFFAIAHETAHFILLCDDSYAQLKVLDCEYSHDASDWDLRSPIEYSANIITLMIFERCLAVAKKVRHREKILRFAAELRKAIDGAP